jgi:hypothetical protein
LVFERGLKVLKFEKKCGNAKILKIKNWKIN